MIQGSISDASTRFLLLTPEQQEWINQILPNNEQFEKWPTLHWSTHPVEFTKENHRIVQAIAKVFPIRLRWYRKDRFGKYFVPVTKGRASYFVIRCRLSELASGDDLI